MNSATPSLTLATVTGTVSKQIIVHLIQDGTGGRAPTISNVTWAAGVAPTYAQTATTGITYLGFEYNGTTWTGYASASPLSTSSANTWTAAQRGAFVTLIDAATITPDFSLANNYNLTLGGNRTLGIPTNPVAGQTGVISVRQDITGSRTLAYAWPYVFPGGVAPTLSTGKLVFDQLYYCINAYSTSTVTVTIASPAVMTWTAHGLVSGQRIQLSTTGALPTGLSTATTYWITVIDANTFNLSTSLANAQAATFITTTGSQSGVHTAVNFSITIANNLSLG